MSDEKATNDSKARISDFVAGEDTKPSLNAFDQAAGEQLQHALAPRHIAMISIGGVIGTGLFLGTGKALHNAGPLGLLLGYGIVGSVCYATMMCLGEMICAFPLPGGHIKLAERFWGKPLAFTMGLVYVYNALITLPAELTAAALLMSYWSDMNPALWISIFLIIVITINLFGARVYGECEFWFASIKVITIVSLIILSACIDLGVGAQGRLGFQYWRNPGAFAQFAEIGGSWGRFLGTFSVLIQASFSYFGTEVVAITAGEAKNPRKTLKSAIQKVWVRICIFYIVGTFCIGLICPHTAQELTQGKNKADRSPWVIAIRLAGIKVLPSIINAVLVTSATSAASSDMYISSRSLYALAIAGSVPRIFARTTKRGLPLPAVMVAIVFSGLAYMSCSKSAASVFGWLSNMVAIGGMLVWFCICLTYLRFSAGLQVQGLSRVETLPFRAHLQPYLAYWAMFWIALIIFFSGFDVFLKANRTPRFDHESFITNYITLVVAVALFYGSSYYERKAGRTTIKPLEELDYVSGVKEFEEMELLEDTTPKNAWEKFWHWIS